MAAYLVWSSDLGENELQARTVEADSYASAAIATHRALILDSGADIETTRRNVRFARAVVDGRRDDARDAGPERGRASCERAVSRGRNRDGRRHDGRESDAMTHNGGRLSMGVCVRACVERVRVRQFQAPGAMALSGEKSERPADGKPRGALARSSRTGVESWTRVAHTRALR